MPALVPESLATPRLVLRPLRQADAAGLFGLFSDPRVVRYWSTPPWSELAQAQQSIARDLATMAEGNHLRLAIERADDGAFLGNCSLFNIHAASRRAELGYALCPSAWNRGYMKEALRAFLAYGFATLGLNRVEADIDPRNIASEKLLLGLGFEKEGYLRERWIVAGEVADTALYGLLRSRWSESPWAR